MDSDIRLLHVDDEPDVAELAATFLERENEAFDVVSETDPEAAIERLAAGEPIDGVISDYDMPGTDGLEFLDEVRRIDPDLPFVLFTGQGSEEIASDAISAGVTDYLQKGTGTDRYTVLANRMENAVERYRSKHAFEASQKRLSLFIEQSPLGVIEWDETFDIVRVNDAAGDILGYDAATLRGESWERIVPENDQPDVENVVSELLDGDGGFHSINENVREDGERIICEWHNRVVTDDAGDVVAIFSQFQDITERREDKKRLEALVDNLPGMIYQHRNEPGWPLELIRGACERLTGYARTEFLEDVGLAERIIHPDDREYVRSETESALTEGHSYELIYRIIRKDGAVRWVWERGRLVDSPIEDVELLEGLLIDISDLEGRGSEAERIEDLVSTLLEHVSIGVIVEGGSGMVLSVNRTLLEMLDVGDDPAELTGRASRRVAAELKDAFEDPETFLGVVESEPGSEKAEATFGETLALADGRTVELDYLPCELPDGTAGLWLYRESDSDR